MVMLIALGRNARSIKSIEVQDRYGDNCPQPIWSLRGAFALMPVASNPLRSRMDTGEQQPSNDLRIQGDLRFDASGIKSTEIQDRHGTTALH
ncbi:hypothetical protein UB23_18910 [Pseudomonas sp. ES3-33]|nr:hypothetical protein UB23_18910 [Pseudomonas sp. ES3-33]